MTLDELGEGLWLRTERQTLRRLPHSKRIVFGIRIIQASLADVCSRPNLASNLLGQIRTMENGLRGYKQLHTVQADLERLASVPEEKCTKVIWAKKENRWRLCKHNRGDNSEGLCTLHYNLKYGKAGEAEESEFEDAASA